MKSYYNKIILPRTSIFIGIFEGVEIIGLTKVRSFCEAVDCNWEGYNIELGENLL